MNDPGLLDMAISSCVVVVGSAPRHRKRSAFAITDAELRLIASAASIDESSHPVSG
jgi:hypothetical protein